MTASRLEQKIFRAILAEDIEFEEGQKALADPEAWRLQLKGFKNDNRWRTEIVETPRGRVYWVWTRHRNAAGYFIGNRVVIDKAGKKTEDEHVARRVKKRLVVLLKNKAARLKAKYPDQAGIARKKAEAAEKERNKKTRLPRFAPKEFVLYCTIIDKTGKEKPRTHRTGAYDTVEQCKAAAMHDSQGVPRSLAERYARHYRLFRAKYTKVDFA
jgi:hypothetical protein